MAQQTLHISLCKPHSMASSRACPARPEQFLGSRPERARRALDRASPPFLLHRGLAQAGNGLEESEPRPETRTASCSKTILRLQREPSDCRESQATAERAKRRTWFGARVSHQKTRQLGGGLERGRAPARARARVVCHRRVRVKLSSNSRLRRSASATCP